MSEQSNEVTLKIDPSIDLGDYETTVEYRKVSLDETYITHEGHISTRRETGKSWDFHIILKKKPWAPKVREKYFFINYSGVNETPNQESGGDRKRLEVGNYFKTRELAQAAFDLAMSEPKE